MPGVAAVLLHEVAQQAAQVGVVALGVVNRDRLVEPAAREDRGQPRAGALDGTVPHGIQLGRRVIGGGGELPVVAAVPPPPLPRLAQGVAASASS